MRGKELPCCLFHYWLSLPALGMCTDVSAGGTCPSAHARSPTGAGPERFIHGSWLADLYTRVFQLIYLFRSTDSVDKE